MKLHRVTLAVACLLLSTAYSPQVFVHAQADVTECEKNDRECLAKKEGVDLKEQERQFAEPDESAAEEAEKRKKIDSAISGLYTEAVDAYNKGDYQTALRKLNTMIQRAPFILPAHVAAIKSGLQLELPTTEMIDMITAAIEASKEVKRIGIQENLVDQFCEELLAVLRVTEGRFKNSELVDLGKTLREVCSTDEEDMFLEDMSNLELDAHPKQEEFTPDLSDISCDSSDVCNVDGSLQVGSKPASPFTAAGEGTGSDPRVCVCALLTSGTNAMLFDWIKSHECVGVNHIVLLDARQLSEPARHIRDWMLHPYLQRKFVEQVFVHPDQRVHSSAKEHTGWAWDPERQDWVLARERRTYSALLSETCSVSCSEYDWQVELAAPETALAGDLHALQSLPKETAEVIIPAVDYAEPKPSQQLPPRPSFITHVSTLPSLRSCKREEDGSVYLEAIASTRFVRSHRGKSSQVPPVVLLPKQGLRLGSFVKTLMGGKPTSDVNESVHESVADYTMYKSYAKCNREGLLYSTTVEAVEEIEQRNGAVVVEAAIGGVDAIEIRENILKYIPSFKQRRRINAFQNHLCQVR